MKEIEGYPGYYITEDGRVWSNKRKGMWLSLDCFSGYPKVVLKNDCGKKAYQVHRLVARAYIPNPDNKPCVNHKNGVKTDNCVENLEWCTHSENTKHSYEKKLQLPIKHTEESKKKISEKLKGNKNCLGKKNSLGYKHSEQQIEKIKIASTKMWENRRVLT